MSNMPSWEGFIDLDGDQLLPFIIVPRRAQLIVSSIIFLHSEILDFTRWIDTLFVELFAPWVQSGSFIYSCEMSCQSKESLSCDRWPEATGSRTAVCSFYLEKYV